jgi:ABC-type tungstate transport system permease subunit
MKEDLFIVIEGTEAALEHLQRCESWVVLAHASRIEEPESVVQVCRINRNRPLKGRLGLRDLAYFFQSIPK